VRFTAYQRADMSGAGAVAVEATWDTFVAALTRAPPCVADKADRQAFGAYELAPHAGRSSGAVASTCAQVFDFDRLTPEQVRQVITRASRFRGLIYTSYSHWGEKHNAIRLILPRDDSPENWRKHRQALARYIGVPSDPACEDPSHIYFVPCYRPGDPPPVILPLTGRPLDPYLLPGSRDITREDMGALAAKISRQASQAKNVERREKLKPVKQALQAILGGEPYAEPGAIDATLVTTIGHFKAEWGLDVNTDSILDIMRQSLDAMPPDRSHEHAREKIERFYAAERAAERTAQEERIKEHFERIGHPKRTEPYTPEEITYMRETYAARSPNSTVVTFGGRVYGLTIEGYRDIGPTEMPDILRAVSPFDVESVQPNGLPRTAVSLLTECGQHAQELAYVYGTSESSFDGTTLRLPTAPLRSLEPHRSQLVDDWLGALAGENYDKLIQWLAWLRHVDRPLICLYLGGASGSGKSMLAKGISRMWGAFVPMNVAFADFNAELLASPFVWGDERFPRAPNSGAYKTEEFRDFIQTKVHTINQKFRQHVKLEGYCRTMLTANNENVFRTATANMTHDDIEAIARRILYIPARYEGTAFCRAVDVQPLVETDTIAQHILALPQPAASREQFAIASGGSGLTDHLAATSNLGSRILTIIVGQIMRERQEDGFVIRDGSIYVLASALTTFLDRERATVYYIAQALRGICDPERVRIHDRKTNVDGRYYKVKNALLMRWADEAGFDTDVIKARLARLSTVGLPVPTATN
jgi:hypothetical protein